MSEEAKRLINSESRKLTLLTSALGRIADRSPGRRFGMPSRLQLSQFWSRHHQPPMLKSDLKYGADNPTIKMASYLLQKIEAYLEANPDKADICVEDIFGHDSSLISPYQDNISMDEFRPEDFIEGSIRNLICNQALLPARSWKSIIQICRRPVCKTSNRIALQILFALTKTDRKEMECMNTRICFIHYNGEVRAGVHSLYWLCVRRLDFWTTNRIKGLLRKAVILQAFKECLAPVFVNEEISSDWIRTTISAMNIYWSNDRGMCARGVCLRDGIFISYISLCPDRRGIMDLLLGELFLSKNLTLHFADWITVSMHLTAHYLARKLVNNFSLSAPSTGLHCDDEAPDIISKMRFGVRMELSVFGMQPDWAVSSKELASLFLTRLQDPKSTLPLIRTTDLEDFSMCPRLQISTSSGVDFDLPDRCCGC